MILAGVLLALGAVAGCGRPSAAAALHPLARVRFMAPHLGPGWHTGEVGTIGECVTVLLPEPADAPVRLTPVAFERIGELRVSSVYDAEPGPRAPARTYTAGADTTGERWIPVDLEAVRRQYGGCTPFP